MSWVQYQIKFQFKYPIPLFQVGEGVLVKREVESVRLFIIKYESVYFPNPDYASKEQSVRMLSTLSNIETEKLSSLRSELSSTDDLISDRRLTMSNLSRRKNMQIGWKKRGLVVQTCHQSTKSASRYFG